MEGLLLTKFRKYTMEIKKIVGVIASLACMASTAQATSVIMEGNYIKTAVSDNGTLGFGAGTTPGIKYDASGTGTFSTDDYLTPGAPFEGFSVRANGSLYTNNNEMGVGTGGSMTTTSSGPIDSSSAGTSSVGWTGAVGGLFDIAHDYLFNINGQSISIETTITALTDLTNVSFARVLDPDPDVITYGSYDTVNGLGYDANGDGDFNDAGDVARSDWAHSEGTSTGLTIGLYSNSSTDHQVGVDSGWSMDPTTYLSSIQDDGNGDYAIAMAFLLGDMLSGESISLDYSYVMGGTLGTTVVPSAVPVPAAVWLFASGLVGLVGSRRRKIAV